MPPPITPSLLGRRLLVPGSSPRPPSVDAGQGSPTPQRSCLCRGRRRAFCPGSRSGDADASPVRGGQGGAGAGRGDAPAPPDRHPARLARRRGRPKRAKPVPARRDIAPQRRGATPGAVAGGRATSPLPAPVRPSAQEAQVSRSTSAGARRDVLFATRQGGGPVPPAPTLCGLLVIALLALGPGAAPALAQPAIPTMSPPRPPRRRGPWSRTGASSSGGPCSPGAKAPPPAWACRPGPGPPPRWRGEAPGTRPRPAVAQCAAAEPRGAARR